MSETCGLDSSQLDQLKGSDPRKVGIARIIHQRTTMGMGWIADEFSMPGAANVSQQIRRMPKPDKKLPKPLQMWINLSRFVA